MGLQKIYYAVAVLFISFISFTPSASGQDVGDEQTGIASWYGKKYHGRRTSSGEVYNRHKHTAAHNGLPLGTKVKVTNLASGKSVIVKINDRGPFKAPRVIDLSEAAFKVIASRKVGLTDIKVEVVELPAYFLAKRAAERSLEPIESKKVLALATPSVVTEKILAFAEVKTAPAPVIPPAPVATFFHKIYKLQASVFGKQEKSEQQFDEPRSVSSKMPIARLEDTVTDKKVSRMKAVITAAKAAPMQSFQNEVESENVQAALASETADQATSFTSAK